MQNQAAGLHALLESEDEEGEDRGDGSRKTAASPTARPEDASLREKQEEVVEANLDAASDAPKRAPPDEATERRLDSHTITQQLELLTAQWMRPGTMQETICKYGIKLFCQDLIMSMVDGSMVVLEEKEGLMRKRQVRWVKIARELCRIDHLAHPPSRIPSSLDARMAARKERREKREERQRPQIPVADGTLGGSHPTGPSTGSTLSTVASSRREMDDERAILRKNCEPPGGNLQRRADQRQMKILVQFISQTSRFVPMEETGAPLKRMAPAHALKEMPRMPKSLESTYSTYMRASHRQKRARQSGFQKLPPRAGSMLASRTCDKTLSPTESGQTVSKNKQDDRVHLPSVKAAELGKENRRSTSAEPAIRTWSDVPDINKRLQRGSGIFKPDLRPLAGHPKTMLAGQKRSSIPASGVSICPMADALPADEEYSDSYDSLNESDGDQMLSRPSSGLTTGINYDGSDPSNT